MTKKILILNGSPREKGNSSTLSSQAAAGAAAAGASVETLYLHRLNINPCDACDSCLNTSGECVIQDDMVGVYPKVAEADVIVLVSPIYWFTYSAQLKLCIDRWYAFQGVSWDVFKGKTFALILAYGDEDLESSGGINAVKTVETMCRFLKADLAGVVHGSLSAIGDAQKHPDLMKQAFELGQTLAVG